MIGRNSSIKTVPIIWAHKRPTMIDCAIVQAKKAAHEHAATEWVYLEWNQSISTTQLMDWVHVPVLVTNFLQMVKMRIVCQC